MTHRSPLVQMMLEHQMGYEYFLNNCEQSKAMSYYMLDTMNLFLEYEASTWPALHQLIPFEYMLIYLFSYDRFSAVCEAFDTFVDDSSTPEVFHGEASQMQRLCDAATYEIDQIYRLYMPQFLEQLPKLESSPHVHIVPDEQSAINASLTVIGYSQSSIQGTNFGNSSRVIPREPRSDSFGNPKLAR